MFMISCCTYVCVLGLKLQMKYIYGGLYPK